MKAGRTKATAAVRAPPNSSDPIPDVRDYLDHGSPRDQLAEGHPPHEFSFFHPAISIYGCLLDLTDHCGATISRGPKFENPCE